MINFIFTVVSANFHLEFRFIFTIKTLIIALTRITLQLSQFDYKVINCDFVLLIGRISFDVINQETYLIAFVLLKHMNCFIELLVVNKCTTYLL